MKTTNFDTQYTNALRNVLDNGVTQTIGRNGSQTKSVPNQIFRIDLNHYPLLRHRQLAIKLAFAEQLWFMAGIPSVEWFKKYSKAWDQFVNTDGDIPTNYGMRYRRMRGDQLLKNWRILKEDPSSRQVCFDIWQAESDAHPDRPKKPNIPCLPFITMNIIGGKMNVMLHQRSCDLVLGLPHDVAGVAFFAQSWAHALGVERGEFLYCIANAHIYSNHFDAAETMCQREVVDSAISIDFGKHDPIKTMVLNRPDFDEADKMVEHFYSQVKAQYRPHPSLGDLAITV